MDPITPVSERYCSHMNNDHADAVLYYIQYYANQPSATTAKMLSIDSKGMDLSYEKGGRSETCRVPINPPLKDAGDGRYRLIAMMEEAMTGLGLSKYQVDKWESPDTLSLFLGGIALLSYLVYLTPVATLKSLHPLLVQLYYLIPPQFHLPILVAIPLIHIFEAYYYLRPKLRKHRASGKTSALWYLSAFMAGGGPVAHYNAIVNREVADQEAKAAAKAAAGKGH